MINVYIECTSRENSKFKSDMRVNSKMTICIKNAVRRQKGYVTLFWLAEGLSKQILK